MEMERSIFLQKFIRSTTLDNSTLTLEYLLDFFETINSSNIKIYQRFFRALNSKPNVIELAPLLNTQHIFHPEFYKAAGQLASFDSLKALMAAFCDMTFEHAEESEYQLLDGLVERYFSVDDSLKASIELFVARNFEANVILEHEKACTILQNAPTALPQLAKELIRRERLIESDHSDEIIERLVNLGLLDKEAYERKLSFRLIAV